MRLNSLNLPNTDRSFTTNSFIKLHNDVWLKNQRIAGKITAGALSLLERLVKEGTTKSLIELDKIAEEFIRDNGCTPTFLGYQGFPNSVCISVNQGLVHGVCTDYVLQDGDLVSFDLGATHNTAIGDSALTMIYGSPKSEEHVRLVAATKEALEAAIGTVAVGRQLGVIGETITAVGRKYGYSIVSRFGGHSLNNNQPHAEPFVSNVDSSNNGVRMQAGMTLAIEPLFVIGPSNETITSSDGWTVECLDVCAHFENTIFIHNDHVEVITERE
jgi:methionyl aminopeptidase